MVELIQALIDSTHAYAEYRQRVPHKELRQRSKLSNRSLDDLRQGEGNNAADLKKAPPGLRAVEGRRKKERTP